jgi:hypothetical protein
MPHLNRSRHHVIIGNWIWVHQRKMILVVFIDSELVAPLDWILQLKLHLVSVFYNVLEFTLVSVGHGICLRED